MTATLNGVGTVSGDTFSTDLDGQCNGTGQDLSSSATFTYDSGATR